MHKITKKLNDTRGNYIKLLALSLVSVAVVGVLFSLSVRADGTRVVVEADALNGWYSGDTTEGGAVTFFGDTTSPYPSGVLALTTDATAGAKAQFLKDANIPLAQVTDLSYYTKQVAGPAGAAVSYQLNLELHGIVNWTTAFIFDPSANGTVTAGNWQKWDVDSGRFWANNNVHPIVVAGHGADPYYTLDELKAAYPNANVRSFGVYAGTFNKAYNVGTSKQNLNLEVDGLTFNESTYDFDAAPTLATSKDQCKDGGWMSFQGSYSNQGQCVSSVTSEQ